MNGLPASIESRLSVLPDGLRSHIERARAVGRDLAARHRVDARAVDTGVAAHDLARALDDEQLLCEADLRGIDITPLERGAPILLHGAIAADWLSHGRDVIDARVLDAVRWHTIGHPGMDDVAKVVFLSDKLDPQKVEVYPYLVKVETLASRDMDDAILEYVNREIEHLVSNGLLIHPATIDLRNELLMRLARVESPRIDDPNEP
ncbi:MAG: hypothetical protein FI707_07670 [SAR202 cluster bacterium]|jgi:predicted HD superfamily hydrolase involved in NAD metabolism|nr:hypothetical protein [Chloroflexota bacterium]MDP6799614.1 bis(5'-nucleosyl)-tetraphosphatase (symmetrical) YqeK [SAR202 cluster bacterium]MQG57776.1 hypothetical protein [SAR202 cluster bacterium]MQG68657.1 hypothetical protein [SAR202 cluster bacterium]HAL47456.1 hypothetical protein [Dehalococcoidia bacterium]|tara:strand:+ start:11481 stop:12095 length:615 start_codon:yes stop_codon:yes gene_type:complete